MTFSITLDSTATDPAAQTITHSLFGGNTLVTYEQLATDPSLWDNIADLGIQDFRFPGGSVTENYFDILDPNATSAVFQGIEEPMIGLDDFLGLVAQTDASLDFVIPTRNGFTQSAAEGLEAGTYGARTVSADYLQDTYDFVVDFLNDAAALGIPVASLEIGNEFWGSGTMTAAEYGDLASQLAVVLQQAIDASDGPDPDIVVQSLTAAGAFSPNGSNTIYVLDGDVYNNDPGGATGYTIDGNGSAANQNQTIISYFSDNTAAAQAIDGVSVHYYRGDGLDGVDDATFPFTQSAAWDTALADIRGPDAPELADYVTEWNARSQNWAEDNRGLLHGSMLVEQLYEMATHGVEAAHVWPLLFDAAQGTALTDSDEDDLAIAGEVFAMMSESLPGLSAFMDQEYETIGGDPGVAFDVHGFKSEDKFVFFLSERAGETVTNITLDDINDFGTGNYFVTQTFIHDGGTTGDDANAEPVITFSDGFIGYSDVVIDEVLPYEIVRIEVTYISDGDDALQGYGGNDKIEGLGGDDTIFAGGGNDKVSGGTGDDYIDGGTGSDVLFGGSGDDTIILGSGGGYGFGGIGDDDLIVDISLGDTAVLSGAQGQDDFFVVNNADDTNSFTAITDFQVGIDTLNIEGQLIDFNALPVGYFMSSGPDGIILNFGDGDQIQLNGLKKTDVLAMGPNDVNYLTDKEILLGKSLTGRNSDHHLEVTSMPFADDYFMG